LFSISTFPERTSVLSGIFYTKASCRFETEFPLGGAGMTQGKGFSESFYPKLAKYTGVEI
jgi:hypothetical protein